MKYGFVLPGGTALEQLEQALLAEKAGWDGVFVWEAAYGVDAWTLLAAIAARTERIKLGTMLTPLPWRRPWKVASQVVTLDQISHGRAVLAVGLGAVDNVLGNTGEELDRKTRAAMMDEGIDLIRGLWEGNRIFSGEHYQMDLSGRTDLSAIAQPVQDRIPIWVVGLWPSEKSMTRVLRCDGLLPSVKRGDRPEDYIPTTDDIREMLVWLRERGGAGSEFDVIVEGETIDARDTSKPAAMKNVGATWWLETRWSSFDDPDEARESVRDRITAGPPRLS